MKNIKKVCIITIMLLTIAIMGMVTTASADPAFNSSNTINLKLKKKKSAKLKGLSKAQKKKKWTFKSSDTSIVKVKRKGKYGYKLTANKKKDGYAVIRATQSKTAIYLLVKVGKGSTSTNGTTRAWASYGRSAFRQGTSAYNTWNKVVNPNSGGNGGNGGNSGTGGNGGNTTKPTPTPTPTPSDPYKGMTAVPASYGADGNHIYPITTGSGAAGKDKNGFYYMLVNNEAIIGYDKKGKAIKAQITPITFTIETVPWFDQYLKSFDNGYYTGNGGPNYIGKNVLFNAYGLSTATEGFVKITTSAPIDNPTMKTLHGVKITQGFIDGNWKGQSAQVGANYTELTSALGAQPSGCSGLTNMKLNGSYYATIGSVSAYGTYRYSVTIDGVTKHVDFKIVNHETEFQNWYLHKYNTLPQAEVDAAKASYVSNQSLPEMVAEVAARIQVLHGLHQNPKTKAFVYETQTSILRGVPSFIATKVFDSSSLKTPGCSLAQAYSNAAARILQQNININSGYWNTTEVPGNGHTFGYTAIWYDGKSVCYPYFYG